MAALSNWRNIRKAARAKIRPVLEQIRAEFPPVVFDKRAIGNMLDMAEEAARRKHGEKA